MSDWDIFSSRYDHPPYDGTPSTYVIASTPRSGSHYLGHLLMQSREFGSPLEYLNPPILKSLKEHFGVSRTEDCFRKLWRQRTSPNGWFGLKLHWRQIEQLEPGDNIIGFLRVKHYIRIIRNDVLDQAISYVIANQSGSFISFRETKREPLYNAPAIEAALSRIKQECADWDAFFASEKIDPLIVDYEQLCAEPEPVIAPIRSRFGFAVRPAAHMSIDMPRKQSSTLNAVWKDRFLRELNAR